MAGNLKLNKATAFKRSGDLLLKNGKVKEAIALYWVSIRDLIFYELEKDGISFQSTSEALTKYVTIKNNGIETEILAAYIFGTQASWDENFDYYLDTQQTSKIINDLVAVYEQLTNDKVIEHLNLWTLNGLLYQDSRKAFEVSRIVKLSVLVISIIILFLPISRILGLSEVVVIPVSWISFVVVVLLIIYSFYQARKSKKLYKQAERLRNYLFLKDIYKSDFDEYDEAAILGNIEKKYYNKAKENSIPSDNQGNYIEQTDDSKMKLALRFQENTFFTYMLYEKFSKIILRDIFMLLTTLFIFIICYFVYLSLFNQDKNTILLFPRILAAIVGFLFTVDYFSYFLNYKKKSEDIKVIDAKLEKMVINPNEKQLLALCDYYNSILWDNIPIKSKFFETQKDYLNELVVRRMKKLKGRRED